MLSRHSALGHGAALERHLSEKSSIRSFTADFDTVGQESEHDGRKMAFSVEICEQIFSM